MHQDGNGWRDREWAFVWVCVSVWSRLNIKPDQPASRRCSGSKCWCGHRCGPGNHGGQEGSKSWPAEDQELQISYWRESSTSVCLCVRQLGDKRIPGQLLGRLVVQDQLLQSDPYWLMYLYTYIFYTNGLSSWAAREGKRMRPLILLVSAWMLHFLIASVCVAAHG